MKIIRIILLILMPAILATGCKDSPEPTVGIGKWTRVDTEFDSVAALVESAFCRFESDTARIALIDRLGEVATRKKKDIMLGRAMYWRAKIYIKSNKFLKAENTLLKARQYVDSISYPYDIARINYEMSVIASPHIVADYRRDMKALEYFESIDDPLMSGSIHINLGGTFKLADDTVSALNHFHTAREIFVKAGLNDLALMNDINIATMSDNATADSLLAPLREKTSLRSIESMHLAVIYDSYLATQNLEYLYRLKGMLSGKETHRAGLAHINGLISTHIFKSGGPPDSIYKYALAAKTFLREQDPLSTHGAVLYALANAYETVVQPDSAIKYLKLFVNNSYAISENRSSEKIAASKSRNDIEKLKDEQKRLLRTQQRRLLSVALIVVIGSAMISILLYSKMKNIRLSHELAEAELEKVRYRLAASVLAKESGNRAINEIADVVKKMTTDGRLSRNESSEIVSLINVSRSDSEGQDAFQKIYDDLRPDFVANLKQDFPELSEGQLRMAAYIAVGMTNQEIASLMGIKQESVIKNRYRMRSKMRLDSSTSLEDALRKYS